MAGEPRILNAELINEVTAALDVFWLLVGATLVFFMQIGFSMLEVGSVQEKSTKNVLIKNACDSCLTAICWSVVGQTRGAQKPMLRVEVSALGARRSQEHGLAYGEATDGVLGGVLGGTTGYLLGGGDYEGTDYAFWLFNWAFVSTAATIVSGAVAERIKFRCYVAFVLLLTTLTYPVVVHWVWAEEGWLAAAHRNDMDTAPERLLGCGVLDFAGSGVVHVTGGLSALLALLLLGPRDAVSFVGGRRRAPPGQSPGLQTFGALALWFGWFGFNGFSTVTLVGSATTAGRAMVMTAVSGAAGGLTGTGLMHLPHLAPAPKAPPRGSGPGLPYTQITLHAALNGVLAGLVGITANCATVDLVGALVIGAGSAAVQVGASRVLELPRFQVDDVVGAVPVHLAAGTWGVVAAGLLTEPEAYADAYTAEAASRCCGVLYGCGGRQLGANLTFLAALAAWVCATSGGLFLAFHKRQGLRVGRLVELVGLDAMMHNDSARRDEEEDEMETTIRRPPPGAMMSG